MGMTTDGLSHWLAETGGTDLLETTIGDLLDRRAAESPDQEAVVYSCYPEFGNTLNLRWSYREYRDRANAVAKGLLALGLGKGDHIAILAANLPDWLLLQMAAAKTGVVLVAVNPVLQAAEIAYILEQGDVQALFFMARVRTYDHLATLNSLITPGDQPGVVTSERLPKLRFACLLGQPPAGLLEQESWRPALLGEVIAAGSGVSDAALAERQATVATRDPVMIFYTSGTTGLPKGAVLTHHSLVNNAWLMTRRWGLNETDRLSMPLPLFHVGGNACGPLAALVIGAPIHPLLGFDAGKLLTINSTERCTFSGGAPTMLLAMMQHPDFARHDLSALRLVVCGAAPVPVALLEDIRERIGADVGVVFGQTESSCTMTQTVPSDPFEIRATTCGVPLPHTEVMVMDPINRTAVPCGERGEFCVRGFLVMRDYYRDPEKTAAAIDPEGWLHTGDLATMDATGHVNIVGRIKDMVIRGGENLFPAEIEEFLIRHPKIAEVQVLGVPDVYFGEELLAAIRVMDGADLTEQEVRDYCLGQISHQKIPRYIQFIEVYPMTASGKVQKFVLRERAIKELGLEAAAATQTA